MIEKYAIVEKTCTYEYVYDILRREENQFTPSLSSYVNLSIYAQKLAKYASIFFLIKDNVEMGMLAIYFNEEKMVYISHFGIYAKYNHKGLGHVMLRLLISNIKKNNPDYHSIHLEVNNLSPAKEFYLKEGFEEVCVMAHRTSMKKNI